MILNYALKARAARGYNWLQSRGHLYDLDVDLLRPNVEMLNVRNRELCPLALSDTRSSLRGNHYGMVVDRLTKGYKPEESNVQARVMDVDKFLVTHGFTIHTDSFFGPWAIVPGTERDWRKLTAAWRHVIAATSPPAMVVL
jgi:hypothetical protein